MPSNARQARRDQSGKKALGRQRAIISLSRTAIRTSAAVKNAVRLLEAVTRVRQGKPGIYIEAGTR